MLRVCPPVLRGFNPPVGGGRDDPSKRKNVAPGRAHEKGISQKQIQQVAENLQSGLLKRMRENANRKNARPMTTVSFLIFLSLGLNLTFVFRLAVMRFAPMI